MLISPFNIETKILAERLRQLRKFYSSYVLKSDKIISQTEIAKLSGLTQNKVTLLEANCKGTIESFITLISFYHKAGFNPVWIITKNNEEVPLFLTQTHNDQHVLEPLDKSESLDHYYTSVINREKVKNLILHNIDTILTDIL
ncbi:MAG: hypothetical protein WBP45_15020 [Daejeonella sp.]